MSYTEKTYSRNDTFTMPKSTASKSIMFIPWQNRLELNFGKKYNTEYLYYPDDKIIL